MRWRAVHATLIESDANYRVHKDAPDSFCAWGPPGSQDIDHIRAHTAATMRQLWRKDRKPEELQMAAGRGLVGFYVSGEEARAACVEHQEGSA